MGGTRGTIIKLSIMEYETAFRGEWLGIKLYSKPLTINNIDNLFGRNLRIAYALIYSIA